MIRKIKLMRSWNNLLNSSIYFLSTTLEIYKTPKNECYMNVSHANKLIRIDTVLLRDKYNITYDVDVHKVLLKYLCGVNNIKNLYLYDFKDNENQNIFG